MQSLNDHVITVVVQAVQHFVVPGYIFDKRTSKVRITYIKLRCNERTKVAIHLLSKFITTCTGTVACAIAAMPYHVGFQSNFSNVPTPCYLSYVVYHTHSKAQIHLINHNQCCIEIAMHSILETGHCHLVQFL